MLRHIGDYIHRILSAGWGFPVWAAAAPLRAIRLRLRLSDQSWILSDRLAVNQ
jgi:hypothetical protein